MLTSDKLSAIEGKQSNLLDSVCKKPSSDGVSISVELTPCRSRQMEYVIPPMTLKDNSSTDLLYARAVDVPDLGIPPVTSDALAVYVPRRAAWLFAAGNLAAVLGFLALCLTGESGFLLLVSAGLAAAAIGLRAAERAVADVQH